MAEKTWKTVSKFRLFTIVMLSLLTSLSLSMSGEHLWNTRDLVAAFLQAAIAGFAYLQCPTIKPPKEQRRRGGGGGGGRQSVSSTGNGSSSSSSSSSLTV